MRNIREGPRLGLFARFSGHCRSWSGRLFGAAGPPGVPVSYRIRGQVAGADSRSESRVQRGARGTDLPRGCRPGIRRGGLFTRVPALASLSLLVLLAGVRLGSWSAHWSLELLDT